MPDANDAIAALQTILDAAGQALGTRDDHAKVLQSAQLVEAFIVEHMPEPDEPEKVDGNGHKDGATLVHDKAAV